MNDTELDKITDKNAQNETIPTILSRTDVLKMLGECITSIHKKLRTGRNRNAEKDKLRQDMLRAQGYLSNVYLMGLKDLEMEELNERLSKLEQDRSK